MIINIKNHIMDKEISDIIKSKRPNLSDNSINTYVSIIKSVYNKTYGDIPFVEKNLNNVSKVVKALSDVNPRTRKTMLSALVVITDNKDYRKLMIDDIDTYNKEEDKQEKNEKQTNSWVESDDIKNLYNKLESEAKYLYKKKNLSNLDLQIIQQFIIMAVLGGVYIPPRRSKDYVDFKIKNINKSEDNYFVKNKFVFNSYKTSKFYGKQEVEIPKPLAVIIRKWLRVNPFDYLLIDTKGNQLSNVKLNQRLNKLFDKKVSVNQLRHTFMSDKYKNLIDEKKEMDDDFKKMGSSSSQFVNYVKKD